MYAGLEILTVLEGADYLKVRRATLYKLIRERRIEVSKVGGRWRIPREGLDDYLKQERVRSPAGSPGDGISTHRASAQPDDRAFRQMTVATERILVIGAELPLLDVFRAALIKRGHSVFDVPSGIEAIDMLKHGLFDFIFMDLGMMGLDAVGTLGRIRAIDPDQAVVLMVDAADGDLITSALDRSPFVLVKKPVHARDILRLVEG